MYTNNSNSYNPKLKRFILMLVVLLFLSLPGKAWPAKDLWFGGMFESLLNSEVTDDTISTSSLSLLELNGGSPPRPRRNPKNCGEYNDIRDFEKFSHCEKVSSIPKGPWQGYVEFTGKPGTVRSLGQSDLFIPVFQDKNDMTFFNLRGQMDNLNQSEYNVGLGHRHIFDEWILGGYAYFDHRKSKTDNYFKQMTLGVEALSETWDFRVNGYVPESGIQTTLISPLSAPEVIVNGNQISVRTTGSVEEEKPLPGFDVEAGYKLPIPEFLNWAVDQELEDSEWFEDTRLYLAAYHFIGSGKFDSVTGPRVRLETRIHDLPYLGAGSRLMLGLEAQYDKPRGLQTFGLVQLPRLA